MSNRGLMMVSIVSGLLAVIIFIMVVSASLGSHGDAAAVSAQAPRGQTVDSEQVYGAVTTATLAPNPTVAPVQQSQGAAAGGQPVEAPAASAPPNPFTAGIK